MKRVLLLFVFAFVSISCFAQSIASQSTILSRTRVGQQTSPNLQFAASVDRTWASPEWEIQDRVQSNRIESNILWDSTTNRIINSGYAKPWNTKFRSKGGIYYYDPTYGHYDAIIDMGRYAGEVDYHNARVRIYTAEEGVYLTQEDRHGGNIYFYFGDHTLNNFQLIDNYTSQARGEPYRLGIGQHLWIGQKRVGLGDVSTFSYMKFNGTDYDNPVDVVIKQSAGKRVYAFKPWGYSGKDDLGYYRVYCSNSSSEAHFEMFELRTQDWDTFENAFGGGDFTVSIGGSVTTSYLRDNGFRYAGEDNFPKNLGDHTEANTPDGRFHCLWYEDYHDSLFYITRNGSAYTKTPVDLGYVISGYYDRGSTYALGTSTSSATIPTVGGTTVTITTQTGLTRLQEISLDSGRVKLVSATGNNIIYIQNVNYNPATGVLSGTSFGAQDGSGTYSDWTLYTAGLRDGVALQFIFERGAYVYAGIRVLLPTNYRRVYIFRSPVGDCINWEFIKDSAEGIPNVDIHKVGPPENIGEIPNGVNFPIYSCKFAYTNTNNGQPGTNYSLLANFGTIDSHTTDPHPETAYANIAAEIADINWGVAYTQNDVVESGGSITSLNDQTANNRDATAVGTACVKQSNAIKSFGSSYYSIAAYSSFYSDSSFTFATVARKVNDCWLLSMGDVAETYHYLGLKMVMGYALQHYVQSTNADFNTITGRGQLLGIDYAIIIVMSDGVNIRVFVNGMEVNKIWSDSAPAVAIQWAEQTYGTAIDNMLIGARITTTSDFTPTDFKEWRYKQGLITYEQRRKLEKTWSTQYSITLRSYGTPTTYEPEAELAFLRMGSPPDATEKGNLSSLIASVKTSQGLNTGELCLANLFGTFYIRATTSSANALINYAQTNFDATGVNSPTFTNNLGYKSNGTSSYLRWNFEPAKHSRSPNNAFEAFAYVVENATSGNKAALGCRQSTPSTITNVRIFPRNASDNAAMNAAAITSVTIGSVTDMRGFYSVEKTGGSTTTIQRETTTNTLTQASQAFIDHSVYELANNLNSSSAEGYLDATVAISGWGSYLINDTALRTALRNWLTSVKGVTGI
jgi:hypothetical protein